MPLSDVISGLEKLGPYPLLQLVGAIVVIAGIWSWFRGEKAKKSDSTVTVNNPPAQSTVSFDSPAVLTEIRNLVTEIRSLRELILQSASETRHAVDNQVHKLGQVVDRHVESLERDIASIENFMRDIEIREQESRLQHRNKLINIITDIANRLPRRRVS